MQRSAAGALKCGIKVDLVDDAFLFIQLEIFDAGSSVESLQRRDTSVAVLGGHGVEVRASGAIACFGLIG